MRIIKEKTKSETQKTSPILTVECYEIVAHLY